MTNGINPYGNKRIPKEDVVAAIAATLSMRQAGQHLGVSYKTFQKYAMEYGVWKPLGSPAGIPRPNRKVTYWTGWKRLGQEQHLRLQDKLVTAGKLIRVCNKCGYGKYRKWDTQHPLVLTFKDMDEKNLDMDNIELLCYNCYFITYEKGQFKNRKPLGDDRKPETIAEEQAQSIIDNAEDTEEITGDDLMGELGASMAELFKKT